MSRRLTAAIWLMLLGVLTISLPSHAETEFVTYDYSDDFQSYAGMVATLNQPQPVEQVPGAKSGMRSSTIQLVALLCKTDGRDMDFSTLSASYIVSGPKNCFTLFFQSLDLCKEAASILNQTDGIIYAEPDSEVHATGTQGNNLETSDHTFHSWGASQMHIGRYLDFVDTWGNGSASIAVIDSGVFPHSLIRPKLLSSGYDYVDNDDDSSNDLFGHGTNVAGIIADCTQGESVYIYSIRVLNESGNGKMSNVVNAVREAKSHGVTIINLSLESTVMSEALDDAILEALSSGVVVVVAAGNSSCDTSGICPAHLTNSGIIVVGAAENSNGNYSISSYSNYGSSVDIYAFGTGITCCSRSGGYSSETGTSMAAPHISALCALLHLAHPELSPGQIEQRLQMAALGEGNVIVPDSSLMIPQTEGFFLSSIKMSINDVLYLPSVAFPQTACEPIEYYSSDTHIATYESGVLRATGAGTTTITVICKGFDNMTIKVDVDDHNDKPIVFPNALECLEDEAFFGNTSFVYVIIPNSVHTIKDHVFDSCTAMKQIYIPGSVINIGDNTFSNAIVICPVNSPIYDYSIAHGLQYIITND